MGLKLNLPPEPEVLPSHYHCAAFAMFFARTFFIISDTERVLSNIYLWTVSGLTFPVITINLWRYCIWISTQVWWRFFFLQILNPKNYLLMTHCLIISWNNDSQFKNKNINWLNYYCYICLNYLDIEMHQIQEAEEFNAERRTFFFSSVLHKSIKSVTALVRLLIFFCWK